MRRILPVLAPAAMLIIIFGTIFATAQRMERNEADWPQIQLAEDAAAQLDNSKQPANVATGKVNMARSLAPFVIIYDRQGKPVAGSGYIDGHLPGVPYGVLTHADAAEYHRVTWQPQPGVRIAAVTVAADRYYVLSGRSLELTERNEQQSLTLAVIGCAGSLIILGISYTTRDSRPAKAKSRRR